MTSTTQQSLRRQAGAIIGLAITLVAAAPAAAADKLTIMLDWFVNPDHGPIVVAKQNGYFKDAGLDVTIDMPKDPADPPKAVAAGTADLAVSYQPQLQLLVHKGMQLRRVGTLVATPLRCLLVKRDGPVQSIAQLKGRKIGYGVAGYQDALLNEMFGRHGFTVADVDMVDTGFKSAQAVMDGKVDAAINTFRNYELIEMDVEGVPGRCFFLEEEGIPSYDELIYVANPQRLDRNAIGRFLAATERAVQFIVNHPEKSWSVFAASGNKLGTEVNKRSWQATVPRFALRPAALDSMRYALFETFLKKHGLIRQVKPVADLAIDLGAP